MTARTCYSNSLVGAGFRSLPKRVLVLVAALVALATIAATTVADNGINPGLASFFTGIAISMYCPQFMGSIGNGTFLSQLQGLQGVPGVPGIPGF